MTSEQQESLTAPSSPTSSSTSSQDTVSPAPPTDLPLLSLITGPSVDQMTDEQLMKFVDELRLLRTVPQRLVEKVEEEVSVARRARKVKVPVKEPDLTMYQ